MDEKQVDVVEAELGERGGEYYVFYDAMQVGLAIVLLDHRALRVLATVVSVASRFL